MDADGVHEQNGWLDEPLEVAPEGRENEESALESHVPQELSDAAMAASAAPSVLRRGCGRAGLLGGWTSILLHAGAIAALVLIGTSPGRIDLTLQGGTGPGTLGGGSISAIETDPLVLPGVQQDNASVWTDPAFDQSQDSTARVPAADLDVPEIDQDLTALSDQSAAADFGAPDDEPVAIGIAGGLPPSPKFTRPARLLASAHALGGGTVGQGDANGGEPLAMAGALRAAGASRAAGAGDGTGTGGDGFAAGPSAGGIRVRYPEAALRQRIEGAVVVHFEVSDDGKVLRAAVRQSSGHDMLDAAAVEAVKHHHFARIIEDGKPVMWESTLRINFTLKS